MIGEVHGFRFVSGARSPSESAVEKGFMRRQRNDSGCWLLDAGGRRFVGAGERPAIRGFRAGFAQRYAGPGRSGTLQQPETSIQHPESGRPNSDTLNPEPRPLSPADSRGLRVFACCLLAGVWLAGAARAQAPGEPIERSGAPSEDLSLVAKAKALREAGRLLDKARVTAQLAAPHPARLELPAPQTRLLPPREIAARARQACLRVGWYEYCKECKDWHLNLAGGYAITSDGAVATCFHCVEPPAEMGEGNLVAVDAGGTVLPVTAVLAACRRLDTALLRVEGGAFAPLPLNPDAGAGDPAYVFSDPLDTRGYFSAGIVNRFYWLEDRKANLATLAGVQRLRFNVSTEWAPGSSGSAVLDACGNAIGHVAVIAPLHETEDDREPAARGDTGATAPEKPGTPPLRDPLITLHEAVPARGVRMLAKTMDHAAAAKPAAAAAPAAEPVPQPAGTRDAGGLLAAMEKVLADAQAAVEDFQDKQETRDENDDAALAAADDFQEKTYRGALAKYERWRAEFLSRFARDPQRWALPGLDVTADDLRTALGLSGNAPILYLRTVLDAPDAPPALQAKTSRQILEFLADELEADESGLRQWEAQLEQHRARFPKDAEIAALDLRHLQLLSDQAPGRAAALAATLVKSADPDLADTAREVLATAKARQELGARPLELKFTAFDGKEVDLSKLRGKVVLLDFWATWCGPCMEEVPNVVAAHRKFKDKDFEIVGISFDEDRKALQQALKKNRMTWAQHFSGKGFEDPLAQRFGITAIPTMWLLDRKGHVVDFDARGDLEKKVAKLLAEPGAE